MNEQFKIWWLSLPEDIRNRASSPLEMALAFESGYQAAVKAMARVELKKEKERGELLTLPDDVVLPDWAQWIVIRDDGWAHIFEEKPGLSREAEILFTLEGKEEPYFYKDTNTLPGWYYRTGDGFKLYE